MANKLVYFRKFGIIDRLKIWIRGKFMDKKLYMVVLDTTESTTRRTVGMGILNTYIVYAMDEMHARQIVLHIFTRPVAEQVRSSLYVYDLSAMQPVLAEIDGKGGLPYFSFMPSNGMRPPKQSDVPNVSTSSGNKTLEQSIVSQQREVPINKQPTVIPNSDPLQKIPVGRMTNGSRSREFHEGDDQRPLVSDDLSPEKSAIINRLGIVKNNEGSDEGVNNRINSSTGFNNNLTQQRSLPPTQNSMVPDKAQILAKMGIGTPQEVPNQEFDADVMEVKTTFIDPSLSEITDNKVLSEEDIKRMQSELDEQK